MYSTCTCICSLHVYTQLVYMYVCRGKIYLHDYRLLLTRDKTTAQTFALSAVDSIFVSKCINLTSIQVHVHMCLANQSIFLQVCPVCELSVMSQYNLIFRQSWAKQKKQTLSYGICLKHIHVLYVHVNSNMHVHELINELRLIKLPG